MQKRLKWLGLELKNFWPGNWMIRHRIITAGVALGVLSLLSPFYMRTHITQLVEVYRRTTAYWEALDRIHELSAYVTESESELRAYVSTGNRAWLKNFGHNKGAMEKILVQLREMVADQPTRARLVAQIVDSHERWLGEVAVPILGTEDSPSKFTRLLIADPRAMRTRQLLAELARELRESTSITSRAVSNASRKAVVVVTYGGVFFFLGFLTLMMSLYYTLMPGLQQLVGAARELKRGNLDYRVHMGGRHETAQLARAFNEMAVSLKAQNEKLKELNQLKTDFVSTVSHELRTPLTAIKGSIGLILGQVTGPIPLEAAEMLKITQKNTDRLIRLINEVLDIAKIEAGQIQMHFDKHSFVETINHAVLGLEAFATTQGIKLVWEKPQISPLVVVDRDRIEQVITNLLSNAIKFTEPGGTVELRCNWESDRVVVEVADNGQGIPEEFLERIFEKFQQAEHAKNHGKEGTGLGLTIAKAIVQEHGGSIWVNSQLAKGSVFSFSLPWNGSEFVETKKASKQGGDRSSGRRILVIDNEPDFTTVLSKMLEHEGYRVTAASSGKAGIELALGQRPDLIILDILMPDIDGFEVRRLLSESAITRDIPVVFTSVSPEIQNEDKINTGVAAFTKPLVPDEFKAWLKQYFASRATSAPKAA